MSNEVINLRKGDKVKVGFNNITVGLGWEPNEGTGGTFDLDVSAIMIDENRKLPTKPFLIISRGTPFTVRGWMSVIRGPENPQSPTSIDFTLRTMGPHSFFAHCIPAGRIRSGSI